MNILGSSFLIIALCSHYTDVTSASFPTQRASNAENVYIWWRHHDETILVHTGCKIVVWDIVTPLNRLISQIHNAPEKYATMHHFVTKMCTFLLQSGALWDMGLVHCGIYEMDLEVVLQYCGWIVLILTRICLSISESAEYCHCLGQCLVCSVQAIVWCWCIVNLDHLKHTLNFIKK